MHTILEASHVNDDNTLIEVRQHIEAMVETFVGKSLDSAHVDRPYDHLLYDELINKYKEKLLLALLDLTQTLYLSMQNKPSYNSPTNSHVILKELINAITEDAYRLPILTKRDVSDLESVNFEHSCHFTSYEELLAIAIINQLVETSQNRLSQNSNDTDSESVKSRKYSKIGTNSDLEYDSVLSCDPTIIITSSEISPITEDERNMIVRDFINQPPSYVLQEKIEEITTTKSSYSDAEEDSYNDESIYPELNIKQTPLKVPFPEAGIDIIDINADFGDNDDNLSEDSGIKLVDLQTWEENWLFKKKKKSDEKNQLIYGYHSLNIIDSPVPMLIPNPSHIIYTSIGTKDIDELSDLSEHNSGCSLEFSDDESEDNQSDTQSNNDSKNYELIRSSLKAKEFKNKSFRNQKKPILKPTLKVPEFQRKELRTVCESGSDPHFVRIPGNARVQSGIIVQFCCKAKGTKPIQFAWFKNNSLLNSNDNIRIFQSVEENILEIKKTNLEDSAVYSCVVFNHSGQQWCDFNLIVREANFHNINKITKRARKQNASLNNHEVKGVSNVSNNYYNGSHAKTSPLVIQRTWAQRVAQLENSDSNFNAQDIEVMPTKKGKSEQKIDNQIACNSLPIGTIADREHKKWESPVEWKDNPYTPEKINSRINERSLLLNIDNELPSPPLTKEEIETNHSLGLSTNLKDLSRYKKDYYIPDEYNKEETLRSYEENEYSNSKYFDLNKEVSIENNNFETPESFSNALNSPEIREDFSKSELNSSDYESLLPSVKELVNKFSINDTQNEEIKNDKRKDSSSDDTIDHLPKKSTLILPQLNYKVAGSLTARSMSREFREKLSQKNSTPMPTTRISINNNNNNNNALTVQPEHRSSSSSTTCSITNEGYASDESNSSSTASNNVSIQSTKNNSQKSNRFVLRRASYWEKRCENGLISDSSVVEDFPPIEANIDD